MHRISIYSLIVLVLMALPAVAQLEPPETVKPQPVCEAVATPPTTVYFQAPILESVGAEIRARGGLIFLRGNQRITASEAEFNVETQKGTMEDATFTTCIRPVPDYRITAREVTLLPNNVIHARKVSLYIRNTRVLVLPSLKLRVGGRRSSSSIFPRPGYDKVNGFTLSQNLRLADTNRLQADADLRLTSTHGLLGNLYSRYGIDGDIVELPGRFLMYNSLREKVLNLPKTPVGAPCDPQSLRPTNRGYYWAFGAITLRQLADDASNSRLSVYRQPHLGVRYIGNQINLTRTRLDPRIEIYPEVTADWGRFREVPGQIGYTLRNNISMVVPINVIPLGESTAIQPIIYQRFSSYDNGDNYHEWDWAVDASHIFPNGSFVSGRYIKRNESGHTPFQFDNVDIFKEFQAAAQIQVNRNIFGLVASYNADINQIFEYEVLYGYQTDCLAGYLSWNNRLSRFSINVTLINL